MNNDLILDDKLKEICQELNAFAIPGDLSDLKVIPSIVKSVVELPDIVTLPVIVWLPTNELLPVVANDEVSIVPPLTDTLNVELSPFVNVIVFPAADAVTNKLPVLTVPPLPVTASILLLNDAESALYCEPENVCNKPTDVDTAFRDEVVANPSILL